MKNEDWNDTGVPMAYHITFRCYGTWLHGDERGSIDEFNNKFQTPYLPPNQKWVETVKSRLQYEPVKLDPGMTSVVESAIKETCDIRNWRMFAINARTNHVHVVVGAGETGSKTVLSAFKANATRKLRETGWWKFAHSPWSEKGSRRNLWNEKSVENAIDYVVNGQGRPLADYL